MEGPRVEGWRVKPSTGKHPREALSRKHRTNWWQRCEWSAQRDNLVLNMHCPSVCLSSFPCVPLLCPVKPFRGCPARSPSPAEPRPPSPGGRSPVKSAMLFSLRVHIPKAPMGCCSAWPRYAASEKSLERKRMDEGEKEIPKSLTRVFPPPAGLTNWDDNSLHGVIPAHIIPGKSCLDKNHPQKQLEPPVPCLAPAPAIPEVPPHPGH